MQYTAFAVAIVWLKFIWRKGSVILQRLAIQIISFNWDHCCILSLLLLTRRIYIYVVVYFIAMKQALSQLFRAVSIKLFDFCLSLSLQLFKFDSSLKQAVNRNWVIHAFWLCFHSIILDRNSIEIHVLQ